jgi:peptidylprolyl isomerase
MKRVFLLLLAAALPVAWSQSAPSPAAKPQSPSATKTPPASSATKPATATVPPAPWIKLPPGVPVVAHGPVKVPFSLRYEEIKVGAGPIAEPHKVYRVKYTGWLAADGYKFDSSDDHPPQPVYDSSLHQVKGDDGKLKMEAGQPMLFMQGDPRMISGWNLGFDGMHVGGRRRLFIPYQMAYGALGSPSPDPKKPGIPPKADLIFDIELVEMMEPPAQPAPPTRPGMPPHPPAPATPQPGAATQPGAAPAAPTTQANPASNMAPAQPAMPVLATKPAPPATAAPSTTPAPSSTPAPTTAPAPPQPKSN